MNEAKTIELVVGLGATELGYTDRYPFTVVEILTPRMVVVQADKFSRTDDNGMSECQDYEYMANPEGEKVTITRRKNGKWVQKGSGSKDGRAFSVGRRRKYHDYSF